jgi:hypothetical protein
VLDLGIARGTFKEGARSYYGRDIGAGALPDLSTYDDVLAAGEAIVAGEAARQTAEGAAFVPMALPTAAEVQTALTAFTVARSDAQRAQVKTDSEREDVSALYPEAQALAVDICDTVEYFYRKDPDPASLRAKASRWGVVYIYDPAETPAPVTNTGGAAPAPSGGAPPG